MRQLNYASLHGRYKGNHKLCDNNSIVKGKKNKKDIPSALVLIGLVDNGRGDKKERVSKLLACS